jgi:hypothetical protein
MGSILGKILLCGSCAENNKLEPKGRDMTL